MEVLSAAIADGCDLERDYEPALQAFTHRATEKRIRNPACDPVMRAAWVRSKDAQAPARQIQRPDLTTMGPAGQVVHKALERLLGSDVYVSWCADLRVVRIEAEIAIFSVQSRFVKTYLESNFSPQLLAAAKEVERSVQRYIVEVQSQAPPARTDTS